MITVHLKGRLGNILFQYAIGRLLALENGTDLCLDMTRCMMKRDPFAQKLIRQLRCFDLSASFYRPVGRKIAKRIGWNLSPPKNLFREHELGFDPEVQTLSDGIHLDGYFQSEQYFKPIEPIIRQDLKMRSFSDDRDVAVFEERISSSNAVSVNIRRGDYVGNSFFDVCKIGYYERAIAHIRTRISSPIFFVFSDDIVWCRHNLDVEDCHFVETHASRWKPVVDLHLMSLCRHNIMSNSTFSWWAAWLNSHPEKIVVVPNRWFNDEIINPAQMRDTVLKDWVRIEV